MVNSAENALYEVKKKMYDYYKLRIKREWWVDHGRKAIIQETRGVKFFVLFKREFFISYGKITGREGVGESINVQDFEYAVYTLEIQEFLYIYPNNAIYKIRAQDLRKEAFKYENESDGKQQYLFSAKQLQRLA